MSRRPERFSVELRDDGTTTTMALTGELNALAQQVFDVAATQALAAPRTEMIIDFSRATYINSTGIALIVGFLGRARAARVLVTGRGLDAHHRELFEITRLSDFMTLEDDGNTHSDGRPA